LYRVARDSAITASLIRAAARGKRVTVCVEVKARFDEERNLAWAERMKSAGVRVIVGMPGLKVHAKVALVVRRGGARYAYLGTGNFNEDTSRLYADHGLFTADPRLTDDVATLFRCLGGEQPAPSFGHLLVAPFVLREKFEALLA